MSSTATSARTKLTNSAAIVSPPGAIMSTPRTSIGYTGKNAARASGCSYVMFGGIECG